MGRKSKRKKSEAVIAEEDNVFFLFLGEGVSEEKGKSVSSVRSSVDCGDDRGKIEELECSENKTATII